tara:strand:- start:770 stop:1099 length:330 start_codon:yes stop_codon:yes gene_type:complete
MINEIYLDENWITDILLKDGKWYEVYKKDDMIRYGIAHFGYFDPEELGAEWHTRVVLNNDVLNDENIKDFYIQIPIKESKNECYRFIVTKLDNIMAFKCGYKKGEEYNE